MWCSCSQHFSSAFAVSCAKQVSHSSKPSTRDVALGTSDSSSVIIRACASQASEPCVFWLLLTRYPSTLLTVLGHGWVYISVRAVSETAANRRASSTRSYIMDPIVEGSVEDEFLEAASLLLFALSHLVRELEHPHLDSRCSATCLLFFLS